MEALKKITLALGALALAGVGCGDDDGDGNPQPTLDGSIDSTVPDASSDAGDSGFACTSGSMPTTGMCGGSHCLQTPAQLKASVSATAACKAEAELDQFCALTSVAAVQTCILQNYTKPPEEIVAATKACSTTALPAYSSGCLDCFVASAVCAAQKCLNACVADPGSAACDECRIREGCIPNFYTCSGIDNPIPGM